MSSSATAPWKHLLLKSLSSNSHLKHSTYFLLATVGSNVRPSNRTVVFRGFQDAKPANTPLESNLKLTTVEFDASTGATDDTLLEDVSLYQRLVGKLMYVTITRSGISYAVQTLSQFMQRSKKSHWEAAIRVVRYLKYAPGQGVWLKAEPSNTLTCWCDSDLAACPNTRRSLTGYVIKFGSSLISWKFKK
uniref:Uncharacterized mitochondrial protein AtMg00810-like n=1 Tax=Nicotiana tabacum TaxID=4097 RepID=A0A1S3Z0V4_TOBAC|nr:PREDICTED: uncharacterized mitochondrial protein AtMg00810-like [Nicotiana tabacum]